MPRFPRLCVLSYLLAAGAPAFAANPPVSASVAAIHATPGFWEPLTPVGESPTESENSALAAAIQQYRLAGDTEAVEPLNAFLQAHPGSSWAPSLELNLGLAYRHTGHYTKALDAWEKAWSLSKNATEIHERAIADRAYAELAELNGRVGRMDRLQSLLKEGEERMLSGSAAERLDNVRDGLWDMEHDAAHSFRCGPLGLDAIRKAMGLPYKSEVEQDCSTQQGTSLAQNLAWALKMGIPLQMAKRQPGAPVLLPSLVHWKLGHYAAVVRKQGDRFLVQDPTFGEEIWVSEAAIDDEATGYALVPKGQLPSGWSSVSEQEGCTVWGKGNVPPKPEGPEYPDHHSCPAGMPAYSFFNAQTSLAISDKPVAYTPPRGYPVEFVLSYFQRPVFPAQVVQYSSVGSKWNFNWLSFITDDPSLLGQAQTVTLFNGVGGQRSYTGYNTTTRTYANQLVTRDQLILKPDNTYLRVLPDGSSEVFGQTDGATVGSRHVFLTQRIDPAGNALSFAYDSQLRLVTVTDAIGHATTLTYGLSSDPYKVTQVTDPFGRSAVLTYTSTGLLASITDAVGMISTFAYGPTPQSPTAPSDFVNAMTTPYGTTTFTTGSVAANNQAWIQAMDPLGNSERLEFINGAPTVAAYDPNPPANFHNDYLQYRNVYFWDKRAMALYPGDYNKAQINHYLHGPSGSPDSSVMVDVLESTKSPLDGRVWRAYAGQADTIYAGTASSPSKIARKLDDGSEQDSLYEYNQWGKTTKSTDPSGRVTSYVYSSDGLDLLEVHNITSGTDDLLAKYTYNTQHRPLTAVDASGQTTTFTYNTHGEVSTVTNAKSETTTLSYDANGYLQSIQGPVAGALTSFTYDSVGRIQSITNPDGYTLAYDYDNLDRRIKVTYPDGTTEQTAYDFLDVGRTKDRLNRWTLMTYNAIRQLTDVQDPQGRVTHLNWCGCGSLESLVDPMGKITSWARDLEGRVTSKIYPDLTQTAYAYDSAGRLKQRTDAKGQITSYGYFMDDDLKSVVYSNAVIPTPSASYTYDPRYNRLASSTGVLGTTTYTYNPVTTSFLGATRLATVLSPMPNSAIAYSYDELGRVTNRSINGVAENRTYDALGRIATVTNPLGAFSYTYDGATNRLLNVAYPNGQNTAFSYFDNSSDKRLKSIQNLKSTGANISTFNYTYDPTGQIQSWTQAADAQTPKAYTFTYDAVGQLLGATLTDTSTSQVLKSYVYGYDDAGNRTTEQINGAITTSGYNNLNQLTGQSFSATPSFAPGSPVPMNAQDQTVKASSEKKPNAARKTLKAARTHHSKTEVSK